VKISRLIAALVSLAGLAVLTACPSDDPGQPLVDPCDGLESGAACTWLGVKGVEGFNGDNHRLRTHVNGVQDMVFLPDGTAWIADFNNYLLRRIHPDGQVESMVGWTDPVWPGDGPMTGIPPGGAAGPEWRLNHPTNLLVAPDGNVTLVAWHNHKILHIDATTGHVTVVSGGGAGFAGDGGPAAQALFKQLVDASYDEEDNLYIVDQQNQRIRLIDASGTVSTVAGTGVIGDAGDGGLATEAEFSWAIGSNPNPSGGIVHHEGKLYVSDTENHRVRVIDLATGMIDALAGTGVAGYGGDGGPALDAQLSAPRDLEIGPDGHLYFADTDNGAVRAIDLASGVIRTVVGTGELGLDQTEGLAATETLLRRPFGVAFDAEGNLYVMDSLNSRIVKVIR
jgi:DNA-binding beta-propeller fold protein YncE